VAAGRRTKVGHRMKHVGWCLRAIAKALFGCKHRRYSWPRSRGMKCYVACLECGKEFGYDWQQMRRIRQEAITAGRQTA
jgi:hypothetical protein